MTFKSMYDHWQLIDNQNKQTNTLIDTSIVHGITNHIRILYKAKDSAKSSSNVANIKINRLSHEETRPETEDPILETGHAYANDLMSGWLC